MLMTYLDPEQIFKVHLQVADIEQGCAGQRIDQQVPIVGRRVFSA